MEGKNMKNSGMVAVFVGVLILTCSPVKAQLDCVTGILPSLLPCQSFLGNLLPLLPTPDCCAAAKAFVGLGDSNTLCKCLKLNLNISGILPLKLNLIPNLCSLTSLLPVVNCLLEPSSTPTPLA